MAELRELAVSAGGSVIAEFLQRRQKPNPATLIGSGKLEELKGAVASSRPDLVIFDHELTPSQQRNLERALDARVIDRTQLILDIFARHAHTREGQLQVELAQLQYLLAAACRTRHRDVTAGRRHRDARSRRDAARDRSPQDLPPHPAREGATGKRPPHSQPAAATARIRARRYGCAGRLHQCRKIDALQCAHQSRRAGKRAHVRHP